MMLKFFFRKISLLVVLVCTFSNVLAQQDNQRVLDEFMNLRFGLFIHWGPVALRGTEIGWSRGNQVSIEEYDQLYKEFNPVLFNSEDWVLAAKRAGMKYLTITSKHHDGFCLWPTKFSEYNIMNSPFKRDVVAELAEACKKHDIKFCVYYTVLDWHDPHYPYDKPGAKEVRSTTDMKKFVETMKNQLEEILINYDPYMLWFDGNWDSQWTNEHAKEVYTAIKSIKPDLIVNNRLKAIDPSQGAGDDHSMLLPGSIGDYATPEQRIGELNMDIPWESCMTIAKQWAWKPNDELKSLKECIQTLAKTAAGNGNLLFNVGPMLDGRIEQRQIDRLAEMGDWLAKYGESIYGTKGGPFKPNEVFATTRKGNKLYVHVFKREAESLDLEALANAKVLKAYFLGGNAVHYNQGTAGQVSLKLPQTLPDQDNSVIVLELETDAESIPVLL